MNFWYNLAVCSKNDSAKVVKESLAEVLARKLGLKMGELRSMDREFQILKEVLYILQNMRWQNTVQEGTADEGELFKDPMGKFWRKRALEFHYFCCGNEHCVGEVCRLQFLPGTRNHKELSGNDESL